MATTQPSTDVAGVAGAPAARAAGRPGAALLLALLAACAYAVFAHGATTIPDEPRLQIALAAVALAATGVAAGSGRIRLATSPAGAWGLGLLVAFGAWCGLTLLWSVAPDNTWQEVTRALEYALVVALAMAVGTSVPRAIERFAVGWLIIATVCALYALGGKLIPGVHLIVDFDHTSVVARLRAPLDYWNALALVLALAAPVALRLTLDRRLGDRWRLAALAALQVLVVTMGMTYSRGGVLALGTAVLVMVALGPGRVRAPGVMALVLAACAGPLAFAFSRHALKDNAVALGSRIHDGRILFAIELAALGLLIAAGWWLLRRERVTPWSPARTVRVYKWLALAGCAAVLVGVTGLALSARGLPGHVSDAVASFTSIKQDKQYDPGRLASTTSGNRWVWWREAAAAWGDRPVGGWGAGSFPVTHLQYRTNSIPVAQPHSVMLQFLAEDGLFGALLAMGALLALLAAALARVRSMEGSPERPMAVVLLAMGCAWFVHGFYDWDWDIPGVTLPALAAVGILCGRPLARRRTAAAVPFRDPARDVPPLAPRAIAVGAATVALCAFAASAALPWWSADKTDAAQEKAANAKDDIGLRDAASEASLAASLDPLSDEPVFAEAAIASARGRLLDARRYMLEAVHREPDDAQAWTRLASVALLLADRPGFERAALRALELDPMSVAARRLAAQAVAFRTPAGASATATGTPLPSTAGLAPATAPAPGPAASGAAAPGATAPGIEAPGATAPVTPAAPSATVPAAPSSGR